MKLHFMREGIAKNSSDDHAVIMINPKEASDVIYDDYTFEREPFLLCSKKAKKRLLQSWIKTLFYYEHKIDEWCNSIPDYTRWTNFTAWWTEHKFETVLGKPSKRCFLEGSVGHQSIPPIVENWTNSGINYEFYLEWLQDMLQPTVGIRGGGDEYELPKYAGMKDEVLFWKFISRLWVESVKARKDTSGMWVVSSTKKNYGICVVSFGKNETLKPLDIPYLVDLNLTNQCNNNCPYCYRGASSTGKIVSSKLAKDIIDRLEDVQVSEIVIGSANTIPLIKYHNKESSYYCRFNSPEYNYEVGKDRYFPRSKYLNAKITTTLQYTDLLNLVKNDPYWFVNLICLDGIALSITDIKDEDIQKLKEVVNLIEVVCNREELAIWSPKEFCSFQIIPAIMPLDRIKKIFEEFKYATLLGYKNTGRAEAIDSRLSEEKFKFLESLDMRMTADATFIEQHKDRLAKYNYENAIRCAKQEGIGSVFMDPIEGVISINSHSDIKVPFDFEFFSRRGDWHTQEQYMLEAQDYLKAKLVELRNASASTRTGTVTKQRIRKSCKKV